MKPYNHIISPISKKLGFLFIFLFASFFQAYTQNCNTLDFTYTTEESRCAATGKIIVSASGGTGNYSYQVTGPIAPVTTSVSTITGLPLGTYTVTVRDIGNPGCQVSKANIVVPGSYAAPSYTFTHTNVTCSGNDGRINVASLANGRSPFAYTIIAPSASGVGTTNTTGSFTNLIAGVYTIQLRDSCGGGGQREVTIETFSWLMEPPQVTRHGCDSADAIILLVDNAGNRNTTSNVFAGYSYGIVNEPGDTSWYTEHSFRFHLVDKRTVNVVAKDPCGLIRTGTWNLPLSLTPSVGSVALSNLACKDFVATVTGQQNLTAPQYCLKNNSTGQEICNSTGLFENIPYGEYCIRVFDNCFDTTITRCFVSRPPAPAVNATVNQSNQTCTTFTAAITGQTNLTSPVFCLFDAANQRIDCNATGIFPGIAYGNYCIRISDGCYDTTITRCFTGVRPAPFINAVRVRSANCNTLEVVDMEGQSNMGNGRFCLYNGNMELIECNNTGVFPNLPSGNYCIRTINDCGDTSLPYCVNTRVNRPEVGNTVIVTNRTCTRFNVSIGGTSNLNNPRYFLLNATSQVVDSSTTGQFTGVPYGSYCIRVVNDPICYDTTITRCFTEVKPPVSITANMTQSNTTCTAFTATITGTGLTAPQYVLFNSNNVKVDSNTTGIFPNLPYGTYCAEVRDACDTTLRICQAFEPQRGLTLNSYVTCTIGSATVAAQMQSRNNPYTFRFYHPDGTLLHTVANTWSNWVSVDLPALPPGGQYRVEGIDNCGRRETAFVTPVATIVNKSVSVRQKCPGGIWGASGSGDIAVTVTSNLFTTTPRVFKKDEVIVNLPHNNRVGNTYNFNNLGPGTYIIRYTMEQCNTNVYDTVVIRSYAAPEVTNSAIYQCENNGFSVNVNVIKGVGPFRYQIFESDPVAPAITTGLQSSPFFTINNGTTYRLIRLRVQDACNEIALGDAAVLPLSNTVIAARDTCLFRSATLAVDTIPNATYLWYKKTGPNDSTLVGTDLTYRIPFVQQNDLATYVSKVLVNGACITRINRITLTGHCHGVVLPVTMHLNGWYTTIGNKLEWTVENNSSIISYEVERKSSNSSDFYQIVSLPLTGSSNKVMTLIDSMNILSAVTTQYRIKATTSSGKVIYSNTVTVKPENKSVITVYPNPVQDEFLISLNGLTESNYQFDLFDINGKNIWTKKIGKVRLFHHTFKRNGLKAGVYLLQVTKIDHHTTEAFKLIFK